MSQYKLKLLFGVFKRRRQANKQINLQNTISKITFIFILSNHNESDT
jgi:hypothetical protein